MNYSQVKAALNAYGHRNDAETVGNQDNALEFARIKLGRSFWPRQAFKETMLVVVAGRAPLPVGWSMAEFVNDDKGALDFVTARAWPGFEIDNAVQGIYSILGDNLAVDAGLGTVSVGYYVEAPKISNAESNYLSLFYADIWLAMADAEQSRFVKDFEAATLGEQYAVALAQRAALESLRATQSGGGIRMTGRSGAGQRRA